MSEIGAGMKFATKLPSFVDTAFLSIIPRGQINLIF